MDADLPTPLHIVQDTRYAKQDGWEFDDVSLCSSGNIAVSGHRRYRYQSYVCIYGSTVDNSDSRDKPTLLYHKQYTDKVTFRKRYVSFTKPNSTEIVTCRDDEVQVIDYNRDVVLRSREVNGWTQCLSVSESQIFIGICESDIVNIYDYDLNRIKSIRLKGIRNNYPWDIAAVAGRLCLRTSDSRAIVYSQDSGSILTEYTTEQDHSIAVSMAVNMQHQILAVLWNREQLAVYSINSSKCLIAFDVESGVSTIRISGNGRIVTGNEGTGEVKIYYTWGDLVFDNLAVKLAQLMSPDEIKELRKHFNILDTERDQSSEYNQETLKKKNMKMVLIILKERGILSPNEANELKTLFDNLGCLTTSKLSGPIRFYQKCANMYADMPHHDQPTVNAGRLNDLFSVSSSHEIPEARFPKQDNWHNQNVENVFNTTHGLVCYIRSGNKKEPNVLTQLFKLPSLDSIDNPQVMYSKVISRQGNEKLFLTFIDETHLVMCYNKTLEIINISSKVVLRGHQLHAAAKTMDVEEGEIFVVVGNSSAVTVFNQNLEEITKLPLTLEDWKHPADMKVTSERLFIICKVKPRDHDTPYNWPKRAMSFRRDDGEMEANYTIPIDRFTKPVSIAAHKESEFVGVLWSKTASTCMVSLHTLSGCCVFVLDVKHSHTIQILNKNTMAVINQTDGLKFYNMAHFFTFNILAIRLSSFITMPECTGLKNFYGISDDEIKRKDSGSSQFGNLTSIRRRFLHLFKILEEKDLVGPSKFDDFIAADAKVRAPLLWSHVEAYWKFQGILQKTSLEAGPSVQVHVPVTQEGGAENLVSVSCQEGASAQPHSPYTGGSHLHPRESISLQPQQQHHQQLHQQAHQHDQEHAVAFQQEHVAQELPVITLEQEAHQLHQENAAAYFQRAQVAQQQPSVTLEQQANRHDQENVAAFQGMQVAQQQPCVILEQQVQQHAYQQALRQQPLLHQQQLYQQQWQQNQAYQEQLQVCQEGLGYNQAQHYQQPVGYSHSFGYNQLQAAFAQNPPFQQFLNTPTAFHRQQLPAIYNQDQGVLHNQQEAAYNAPVYSQLPGGSAFVQHQQEQYATLPYQQQHYEPQIQQQELQRYPPYQPHTSLQHQVVAPSHDELGQHDFAEQMTGRQGTISLSSSQHPQQELQYQAAAGPLPVIEGSTVRDKRSLFLEFLKKKITSLSEMNYFTPWEKSFRWKSIDLFVSCWLVLNDRKAIANVKNIEDQCKLKYTEIFTHDRLKSETRIIIEGGPGTGKTMLLAQLAFDWSTGKIEHEDVLIFLPLKTVKDKTLIQAIKEFYIPENAPLSGNDIANILASNEEKICLLLDGLEESSGEGKMRAKESCDVRKVMKKEEYPNCKVVVTCHSYLMHDLPDGPLLKIGQFGEGERNSYIEKLSLENIKKEEKMKQVIEDDLFLLGLCSIPLLFAITVHNIESMIFAGDSHFDKVAPFMKTIVETLCASSMSGHETWSEKEQLIWGELAFNGLCKSHQQFSWPKDFIETKISRLKQWLDCRILVLERDMKVPGMEFQDIAENYEKHNIEKMEHVTGKTGTSRSLAQDETQQYKEDRQERETQSNEATVGVRFLHEIIQEWFAATYLCSMMNYYTDEDRFHEYVINQLNQLSPKDLHYVLRFTSYLHPRSCHAIINYLLTNFLSDDGSIESHVMDCICFCFAEHNDIKGTDIKNSVAEVCKEVMITIDFEDGRLLQKAKSSLLEYASNCGVIIKEIELSNVISAVDETSLTFNSGIKLPQLDTLEVIEVSQWDQVLHQDDFENILKLLSKGKSIKTILCVFPCHPPKIVDEVIIENVISKNIEVAWNNRELTWTLDPKNQIFIPILGTMRKAGQMELKNKGDDFMSNEHFLMSLPGTSSAPFGKWSTKRPLSKMFSDMKLDIASKRLKMNWILKLKGEKEYKEEEVLDLSKDSILEGPFTSYVEEKFITKEETPSQGRAQVRIKEETAESDFEQKFWTVSPAGAHEQSQDTDGFGNGSVDNEFYKLKVINEKGGTLTIPEAGVRLEIGPGALSRDHTIQIKVPVDLNMCPPNSQVLPRLTPLILCEPSGLEFIIPVKLTVPHCAVIQEPDHHKVTVEIGHKNRSMKGWTWTEETVAYSLTRKTCSVFLRHFSGVNVNIDSTEEQMLRVIPYAKLTPHSNNVLLTLWFCNDLEADFQSVMKCGENDSLVQLDSYDTFKLRHVKGAESVKVTLKDASNQWFQKEFKDCIDVNSLAGENQLYRDFRLPTVSDQDNGTYIYLDLRVTQRVGEKESETSFTLRKRVSDLRKPVCLRRLYSPCENEERILSFQEYPTDRCFAVPYIDPMRDHEDDVILTLWLCPFESQREKLQCLQKEQKLLLKHMVKSENSFALTQQETVTAITKFLNGSWRLTPKQEIETKRIQYGSRAKFQFIGKKEDKDEIKFINLEVHTFQDENHRTPFIEEVDVSLLLYESKHTESSNTEDLSGVHQASNLVASVVPSNLEHPESSQCSLFDPSCSSEDKTREFFPPNEEVKSQDEELKFIFLFLKRELAAKWKDVARYLGMSEGDIDCFGVKYKGEIEEGIYKMFLHWKQKQGQKVTPQQVKNALRRADRKDLSDKIDKGEHLG